MPYPGCLAQWLHGLAAAPETTAITPPARRSAFDTAAPSCSPQRPPLLWQPLPTHGHPVYDELRAEGIITSRKRIARLMRQEGLAGRSRRRRRLNTTDSRHTLPVAANLLDRCFTAEEIGAMNRFWCGDITYVATQEGWQYLAGCPLGGFRICSRAALLAGP